VTRPAGSRLLAISTGIGRGHPSYLDSVLSALYDQPGPGKDVVSLMTLDQVCTGTCRGAWNLARSRYRTGARGGLFTVAYNRLRRGAPGRWQLQLLGADLERFCAGFTGICLVEHPLVARILAPVCRVAYLHGEIAAPASGAVPGTWRTFVPLESTASELQASGVERSALSVTGLVVEPELVRLTESAFETRLRRLNSNTPLTIGFFTSGAYPKPHLARIVAGVKSCLDTGHRPVVFAGTNRAEAERLRRTLVSAGLGDSGIICSGTRRQETARTAELFPQMDVMIAAAHERTNWAVGLGLPLFALQPDIGPFAPLNRAFAEQAGVARPLDLAGAGTLGSDLTRLRDSGALTAMADSGYDRLPTDGVARIARHLLDAATR
jgi:hypothetical protein